MCSWLLFLKLIDRIQIGLSKETNVTPLYGIGDAVYTNHIIQIKVSHKYSEMARLIWFFFCFICLDSSTKQ